MESNPLPEKVSRLQRDIKFYGQIGKILCSASLRWPDGVTYACERDDSHDGEELMHGAIIDGEWTNWTDSYLEAYPEYSPETD